MITTEQLFVSPAGFRIVTATACQRAACRIIDGLPLGDLASDPAVVEFVGGPDALPMLPSERGVQPTEVLLLAAIRTAKSILASAAAIRATQVVDVSKLGPGEIPRVSVVSLKLDVSAVVFRLIVETIRASSVLRPLLVDEPTSDAVMLRHPSGRPIEIACVAGAKAGAGLVARWSAGVIFDEAARMTGADDGVVNLDHARSAVLGRLLPHAQVFYPTSPWAPFGPIFEMAEEHWRRPSEGLVVLRGTGPTLNPQHWTPERCDRLRLQDPTAFQTDVLGEFADLEGGLLSPIAVRTSTRDAPLELPPVAGAVYVGEGDLSDVSTAGNASTLVVLEIVRPKQAATDEDEEQASFRVVLCRQWRGVGIERCLQEMADIARRYQLRQVGADRFAGAANAALAKRYGLEIDTHAPTAQSNLEDYEHLAHIIHTGRIELAPDRVLLGDLLAIKKRTTQKGFDIVLPRTSDGRHCDYAPALAGALKRAGEALRPKDTGCIIVVRPGGQEAAGVYGSGLRGGSRSGMSSDDRARRFFNDEFGGPR